MQKFLLQMLAIFQKNQYFDKPLRTFLAIVMQILKQFGFLFQIQTCDSHVLRRAPITKYAFDYQSLAPPFCKKFF